MGDWKKQNSTTTEYREIEDKATISPKKPSNQEFNNSNLFSGWYKQGSPELSTSNRELVN
jgi:hypothetical protein